MPNEDRITKAAATRRAKRQVYDGPTYRALIGLEIKAPNRSEAQRRTERLLAELVTGQRIEATDMWVKNTSLYDIGGGNTYE